MARKSFQKGTVELHNGQWTLRFRERDKPSGKWAWKRKVLENCPDETSARAAADLVMEAVNERNNYPGREVYRLTFARFVVGRWQSYTKSAKHEQATIISNNSLIKKYIMPAMGGKELSAITPSCVADLLDGLEGKVSTKTILNIYGLLHLMFEIATQYDLITRNPVRPKLHKPQHTPKEKPTLTALTVRQIIMQAPAQYRLFLLVLATTGMRLGEALALRWLNFNEDRSELSVTHSLFRGTLKRPKTEASRRTLHLPQAMARLLIEYKAESQFTAPGDYIFCRGDGKALDSRHLRERVLYPVMDALGVRRNKRQYGFHIFRHTAGSIINARTRDLKLVQGTLGHSRISTISDIYVHLDESILEEGTEVLVSEILGDSGLQVTIDPVTQSSEMVS